MALALAWVLLKCVLTGPALPVRDEASPMPYSGAPGYRTSLLTVSSAPEIRYHVNSPQIYNRVQQRAAKSLAFPATLIDGTVLNSVPYGIKKTTAWEQGNPLGDHDRVPWSSWPGSRHKRRRQAMMAASSPPTRKDADASSTPGTWDQVLRRLVGQLLARAMSQPEMQL
ncbi:uncharacterized protein TRIREDRAFT_106041 [Trichoderma reesei QM6a]|uniref:Predicted protein n=1 Tax=Hypocrea jecorina (strain QM6a) TaxID=431241 RepID=G0RG13_HYPJQ|nr:uncharacterized protein TRIREDRAFT_106041 [Trichoderma reesei QM6a]EGR49804.1 predicted protein [Trichoderma reesei QM6a]